MEWLKRGWVDLVLILTLLAMLVWIWDIARHHAPDKATWLLIPVTAIYVVSSFWIVAAGFRSAAAATDAANTMRETLNEMRFQANTMYAPLLRFPEGFKCCLKTNGNIELILTNLHDQPALNLQAFIWEMEAGQNGQKECKYSSLRESVPADFAGAAKQPFILSPSKRTDTEKTQLGIEAVQRFQKAFDRRPISTVCALAYSTKVSFNSIVLVFDLEVVPSTEIEKVSTANKLQLK